MLALSLKKSLRLLFECPGCRSFWVQGEDFVDRSKGRVICALIQRLLRAIESRGNALLAFADGGDLFDGLSHFPRRSAAPCTSGSVAEASSASAAASSRWPSVTVAASSSNWRMAFPRSQAWRYR